MMAALYPGCDCAPSRVGCPACAAVIVGEWLVALRTAHDLTPSRFGRLTGLTTARVRQLEAGRAELAVAELARIGEAFNARRHAARLLRVLGSVRP